MIKFNISEKEVKEFENLDGLFTTARDIRNDLFGSYLTEGEFDAAEVLKKVEGKIKTYEIQLQNLRTLNEELKRVVTEQNVEKMLNSVKDMSNEQAQALLEKLQAKVAQK